MRPAAALTFIFLSFCAATASGAPRENAVCVQNQLAALGHAPGPIDGIIGPQSIAAASDWLDTQDRAVKATFPGLSQKSAFRWCRQLGALQPGLATFWPSAAARGWGDRLYVDEAGVQGTIKKLMMVSALTQAEEYFRESHQIELAATFDVLGAENASDLNRLIREWGARRNFRSTGLPQIADDRCGDDFSLGIAMRYLIALSRHPSDTEHPLGWSWWEQHLESIKLIAHEFAHMVQYDLSADYPLRRIGNDRQRVIGPKWMTEGTAEYFAQVIEADRVDEDLPGMFWLYLGAYGFDDPLRDLRDTRPWPNEAHYDVGHFAVRILADIYGPEPLLEYWINVGKTQSCDQAFRDTFGMDRADFERDFEAMRKDVGQILTYKRQRAELPEIKAGQ